MAQISYNTFERWGYPFIAEDYEERFEVEVPNAVLAGLVVFDNDTLDTVRSFIKLAADARTEAIMIELCNLTNYDLEQAIIKAATELFFEYDYVDLQSYENRLAFGKDLS